MLCCVALRCVALRCVALRFVVLCCVVLSCVVLCCLVLCCLVLCCVVLCCVVLCCVVLCCVVLYCIVSITECCLPTQVLLSHIVIENTNTPGRGGRGKQRQIWSWEIPQKQEEKYPGFSFGASNTCSKLSEGY